MARLRKPYGHQSDRRGAREHLVRSRCRRQLNPVGRIFAMRERTQICAHGREASFQNPGGSTSIRNCSKTADCQWVLSVRPVPPSAIAETLATAVVKRLKSP